MTTKVKSKYYLEIFKDMTVHHQCVECKTWFVNKFFKMAVPVLCPSCAGIEDLILESLTEEEFSDLP